MARLPRLAVPGAVHYAIQPGIQGTPLFRDATDRRACAEAMADAAAAHGVVVHAYALLDHEIQVVATPREAGGLSGFMQALGRRYVAGHNRRHGRAGPLWQGRFRAGPVAPGDAVLEVMVIVDAAGAAPGAGSGAQRSGAAPAEEAWLREPAEFWALGNTPFDREAAYRHLLQRGVPPARAEQIRAAAWGSWAIGFGEGWQGREMAVARRAAPLSAGRRRVARTGRTE